MPEYAIQTSAGVRVADVAWRSNERWNTIRAASKGPAPIAPEICIDVISDSNTLAEMQDKRALYFDAGAHEVWLCDDTGRLRFYAPAGELGRSILVPSFPQNLEI